MSDAMQAFQAAAVAAFSMASGLAELTGIYDGPPPRATFPYLSIAGGMCADWSTKTAAGRELRFAVTIWDDPGDALRLYQLMAAAGDAIAAVPRDLPGWRIVSSVFLRSFVTRDPAGPWAGLVEQRVRMLTV